MNLDAAVRTLNQKAAEQKWHYFCDNGLAFTDDFYDRFLTTWETRRGSAKMPRRSQITPRDLKDVLRNIALFERISTNPSQYMFRLIGSGLTDIAGHVTGKTFEECVPAELVPRWNECGDLVLNSGQPLRFIGRVHFRGREYLDAEHLYVPLANDKDEPSFIMCLCRYTPRRSENEESWENQIASIPGALL
ncbi:MAG: PAS domain-containing protein [Alphaproteobacteria bacterium]|nr:PAS domain-containing protein [Alphaproteobacteria bacterium]